MNAFIVGATGKVFTNFRVSDSMGEFIMEPCVQSKKAYTKNARKYGLPEVLSVKTTGDHFMDAEFLEGKMKVGDFMMNYQFYIEYCEERDSDKEEDLFECEIERECAKWNKNR
jgi:hypothetical protein